MAVNKAVRAAASKRWSERNPEKVRAFAAGWRAANPHKAKLITARSHAKRRGIPFDLKYSDVEWSTHCPVLGIELNYQHRGAGPADNSPSLDRVDNAQGYVPGNVRVISNRANQLKNALTPETARRLIDYMERRI